MTHCPETLTGSTFAAQCTRRPDHTNPELHAVEAGGRVLISWVAAPRGRHAAPCDCDRPDTGPCLHCGGVVA